jgi:hypothetical protein
MRVRNKRCAVLNRSSAVRTWQRPDMHVRPFFGGSTGVTVVAGGSLVALRPRLSAGLPLSERLGEDEKAAMIYPTAQDGGERWRPGGHSGSSATAP